MQNYSMIFPAYSIGTDIYQKISSVCRPYGQKIIAATVVTAAQVAAIVGKVNTGFPVFTLRHLHVSRALPPPIQCLEPLLQYGQAALTDNSARRATYALEQVILAVIVTTGLVSILVTKEHTADYNSVLFLH